MMKLFALIVAVFCFTPFVFAEEEITLKSDEWAIKINPSSLQVMAKPDGKGWIQLSAPQTDLGKVKNFEQTGDQVSWELPEKSLDVSFQMNGSDLSVYFRSDKVGSFTWPIVSGEPPISAYILPLHEGSYVPLDDARWREFLVDRSPMNTTEGLSMPFWGLDCGDYTLTYILTNQFTNDLAFDQPMGMKLTHNFGKLWKKKEYGLIIRLGDAGPVEPAKQYREYLIQQGQFVSMRDKIKSVPNAEKLMGAAHIYLWGDSLVSRYDVLDWKGFTAGLIGQGKSAEVSPGKRIWELMSSDAQKAMSEIAGMDYPHDYIKNQVTDELSSLLTRCDFYDESVWGGVELSPETSAFLDRGIADLTDIELQQLNGMLLEAAFPGKFVESHRWGNGVSVKMMEEFEKNGFDRLWLGLASWEGAYHHPRAIAKAAELGYLIGTYDSYHSIHHPDEPDTWETAQFDLELYETGGIVLASGKNKSGFNQKGYILSPIVAKPYVEKRMKEIMSTGVAFNSWFVDCDAFGELFDDYSELHTATQEDGMNARLDRMAFIRDKYNMVVGSEGGSAYSVPTIHFVHGMMTPVIGWGDPDMKNKESEYYIGAYWPPDGPAIQMKQVPMKEKYYHFHFDPRFRLPLYQTVFHDSIISTHHWGSSSLKFIDHVNTNELLELLYNVPPLYNMNLGEFKKHKEQMEAHYAFFSPLHRELGLLPMSDFAWLTPDRMVQRTVFGNEVEMVANFGTQEFSYQGKLVPGRGVLARWINTGETQVFIPDKVFE